MLGPDALSLVVKRADFVTELADQPLEKREMVDVLGYSRATVNRAVRALEDADLVRETPAGYEPTLAATLAVETYHEFVATETDVLDARAMLAELDHDAGVAPELLRDAARFPAADAGTYANFERVRECIDEADVVEVLVSTERALPALDHWQNALVGVPDATVVLDESLHESVRGEHRSLSWLAEQGVDVLAGDAPSFTMVLTRGSDAEAAFALLYDEAACGFGLIRNDSTAALEWARSFAESGQTDADVVGETFESPSTNDAAAGRHGDRTPSLPRVLEAEGFVMLSESYFETHRSRDLATALRTGVTLADVRDGLAIDRRAPDESTAESLTGAVLDRLDAGEDVAVVGQPGAGKSTVCKAVACQWDDRDRGTVLYRASGQRQPVESVASLRAFLRERTDDVLVVVEDAVRPEANAVMEVAAEFAAADDVQFLVDSRESDWSETRLLPVDAAVREYKNTGFAVATLSPPTTAECRRLVDRYEAETGTTLDVAGDQLLDRLDDEDSVSGGMFLLAHHICLHADPLSTADDVTPTPLVEDVQQRIKGLQRNASTIAMDAALLTAFLNVAEIPVHEEFLQAQTVDARNTTTDGVLSAMTARQLVVDNGTDGLRAPHNQWSLVFLIEALDALDDAPQRLGRALNNVLALVDDETRTRIETRTRNSALLRRIAADPTTWADDLTVQLFEAGKEHLGMTPYYGTFENPTFDLESACSVETVFECRALRAYHLTEGGDLDAAAAEYQTVLDAIADSDAADRLDEQRAECLLVLGSIRGRQGDLEAYEDHTERALRLYRNAEDDHGVARCHIALGQAMFRRGAYEQSREYAMEAASMFEMLGELDRKARSLGNAATYAFAIGDYEQAASDAQDVLDIRQTLGTNQGLASPYMTLGRVAERRGAYERAMEHHRQCLSAAQRTGNEHWSLIALNNMGNVAMHLGQLDDAASYFSRAAEYNERVGEPKYDTIRNETLAEISRRRGDRSAAKSHAETALEQARAASVPHLTATVRTRLGQVALEDGDHTSAREHLDEALDSFREDGEEAWQILAHVHRGRVELDADRLDAATRHVDAAEGHLDAWRDLATDARVGTLRGRIRLARGDDEGARECFEEVASYVDEVTDPYVRASVYRHLGAFADASGDDERARECFETACELADSIGAGYLLDDVQPAVENQASVPQSED